MNYIKYIFSIVVIMLGSSANAGYFEYEGLCYNTLSDSTVEVINANLIKPNPSPGETYNDSIIKNGKIVVPQTVLYFGEKFNVVRIGSGAFNLMKTVKEYELPRTITSIGSGAFSENESLENINIPENVTTIESSAFYKNKALKNIYLPNGISFIGKSAFEESGITTINLPSSTKTIEKSTFHWCRELKDITIPDKVEIIDERAFESCINLESVHIGSGLKEIKEFAFVGCNSLANIEVSEDNPNYLSEKNIIYSKNKTKIYLSAPNQTDNYMMPQTVKSIELRALQRSKFYSIKFSKNLEEIGKYGLGLCDNLMSLVLPSSLTYLGYMSTNCNNLRYLILGENFRTILDYNSFSDLEKIICYNVNPPSIAETVLNGSQYANIEVYVPESAIDAYKAHPRWSKFKEIHGLSKDELIFRPIEAIGFEYNKMFINKNEYFNIGYTIYPKNATVPLLRWEVSNPEIVKIDTDLGKGMGLSEGTCTITAYSVDGSGIEASFVVEVKDNAGIDDSLAEPMSEPVEYYNIHGIKLMQPTKGVNIVKYKDGTVRKVYNR